MDLQGIKTLIIDFGGVLIDLDRQRCINSFVGLGLPDVGSMLDMCHQHDFFLQHEKGVMSDGAFREEIRRRIPKPVTDEQIDAAWNSFLVGVPAYKLDFVLQLRRRYTVYMLSNTNGIHWQWSLDHVFNYKGHRVEDFFDRIFLSFEMKSVKPDVEIFRRVIAETGLNPAETFFIDDAACNCQVARSLGIRTYTPQLHEDWRTVFNAEIPCN